MVENIRLSRWHVLFLFGDGRTAVPSPTLAENIFIVLDNNATLIFTMYAELYEYISMKTRRYRLTVDADYLDFLR